MADLRDFYFQQLVTEADLDEAFTLMQAADQDYVIDNGQVGVYYGLAAAEAGVPNLTVQVTAGAAYDQTGQRMAVPSTQLVNVAVDSNAVSTTVAGVGNSKIISVYIKFKRVLGNPKTDGNNASIQYDRDEGYEFIVRQSTEAIGPTAPSLQADEILLADITRVFGGTTVVNAAIGTSRRQWAISATSGAYEVRTGQVDTAIQAVLDVAGNHIVDAVGAHAATAISNTPAGTIAATTVQAAIDELHTDIEDHKVDASGAHLASAITNTPAGAIVAVTVQAALNELDADLTLHKDDAADAHAASAITNTAAGNIVATTVQAAINELDTEKGGLGLANTWTDTNLFNAASTFAAAVGINGTALALAASTFKARSHSGTAAENNTTVEIVTGAKQTFASQSIESMITIPVATNEMVMVFLVGTGVESGDVTKYAAKVVAGLGWNAGAGVLTPVYILGGVGANFVRTSTNTVDDSWLLSASGNNLLARFSHNVNTTNYTAGCFALVLRVKP